MEMEMQALDLDTGGVLNTDVDIATEYLCLVVTRGACLFYPLGKRVYPSAGEPSR